MKHILLAIFILFVGTTNTSSQSEEDFIYWSKDRPLTWKDFKGKPMMGSSYHAQTQGILNYEFDSNGPRAYTFKLNVRFNKKESWAKPKETTDNLLDHEQGHFDIYEIYGRIIMKRIRDSKALSNPKFSDLIEKIFRKTFAELQAFQKVYDKETNHSKDKEKQKEWRKKLQKRLEELKAYEVKQIAFKV